MCRKPGSVVIKKTKGIISLIDSVRSNGRYFYNGYMKKE